VNVVNTRWENAAYRLCCGSPATAVGLANMRHVLAVLRTHTWHCVYPGYGSSGNLAAKHVSFCILQSGFICWILIGCSSAVHFHHWYREEGWFPFTLLGWRSHIWGISKAYVVQCSRILCEDAFVKALHNWKWFLLNFLGFTLFQTLCIKWDFKDIIISHFQICIKCDHILSLYQTCHERRQ
jgi:hypothetical protein